MREPALRLPSTSRLIAVGLRHPLLKLANFEARCHNTHYRAQEEGAYAPAPELLGIAPVDDDVKPSLRSVLRQRRLSSALQR